ncbi:MAG: sigma-E processing peptidase SpoIIGA [Oscillospiraceae bacterium]|nr:sigma-E processing peptidase SpoIIGA [Oscillospiraceae bacterium]
MPVIYIDVLLALNLFIDFLLLSAVARILRLPQKRIRLVFGALTGSICSCLVLLPDLPAPLPFLIKISSACLIVRIAFSWRTAILFIKQLAAFLVASALFAGIAFAVYFFAAPTGLYVVNGVVYYDVSALTLTLLTVLSYFALIIYDKLTHKRIAHGHEYRLKVTTGKDEIDLRALYDTGHHATDAFSGNPVVVVGLKAIEQHLPDDLLNAIRSVLDNCNSIQKKEVEYTDKLPVAAVGLKLRLIPFHTVNGTGLLPAFKPAKIEISTAQGISADATGAYVAVCKVLGRGDYDAIIGPDMLNLFERSKKSCVMQ